MAHHIFCNKFMAPEEGCKMCEGLREKYPEYIPPDELVEKYFPSAIPIPPPNKVLHQTASADCVAERPDQSKWLANSHT